MSFSKFHTLNNPQLQGSYMCQVTAALQLLVKMVNQKRNHTFRINAEIIGTDNLLAKDNKHTKIIKIKN